MSVAPDLAQPSTKTLRPEGVPDELPLVLPARLRAFARNVPDRDALRVKQLGIWQPISWAQYYDNTAAVGRALHHYGVRAGDHISILSDNCPEWLYADLGAQGIGARSVGIYQTNPPEDVAYILNHSDSKVIFCQDQEQVDKVLARDDLEQLRHIVVFETKGMRHYRDRRLVMFGDFIAKGRQLLGDDTAWFDDHVDARDPDEVTMIIYTSGTTGPPKGAMLTARNALASSDEVNAKLGIGPEDTILSYLPLCHVAEKIFTFFLPLTSGVCVHFGESIYTIQKDLAEVQPTIFLGVPRIWEKVHAQVTLKMKDSSWLKRTLFEFWCRVGAGIAERRLNNGGKRTALDNLLYFMGWVMVFRALRDRIGLADCRLPVSGAAPISADLLRWFHAIGVPIYEGYGMTECAGVSHLNLPKQTRLGTVGVALPGVECQIADDGELLVRGDNVFAGYLHNEAKTREAIDDEGWLHTGDIGSIDDDGFLQITGRKKEIIITAGGKNLSPEKIENALKMSPYVKEAVAFGDQRKFISALIQIDFDAVGDWASRRKITYTSFEDLSSKQEVVDLIRKEVKEANELLARVESVREFRLFPKELHQDDGEVTATQKVRRRAIGDIYADLIDEMYTSKKK